MLCHARRIVSDAVWKRYAPYLPGRRPGAWGGEYPKYDNRTVLEAVLWIARTGSPGRDLPAEFGRWDTIYRRCHRRCQDGVFSGGRFEGLTANLEPEWDTVMVAGTFVKVHQHGAGASKADARTTLDGRRAALAIGHWPLASVSVAGDCPPGLWRWWIKWGNGRLDAGTR